MRTRIARYGLPGSFDAERRVRLARRATAAVARRMVLRRRHLFDARHRHVPGVDQVDLVVAVVLRQAGRPDRPAGARRNRCSVTSPSTRARDAAPREQPGSPIGVSPFCTSSSSRSRRKPMRCQASPCSSPPFAHQIRSSGCGIGLAVAGIAAAHHRDPEAVHQLLRGDVAPGLDDVALVLRLVVDHRLAVGLAPFRGALHVPVLDADMADPRLAVVEVHVDWSPLWIDFRCR